MVWDSNNVAKLNSPQELEDVHFMDQNQPQTPISWLKSSFKALGQSLHKPRPPESPPMKVGDLAIGGQIVVTAPLLPFANTVRAIASSKKKHNRVDFYR